MTSFADIDIRGILPQREPFLFVDRLLHYDDGETVTAFTVPEGHLLVEDGKLTTSGVLENMAQSSAAPMFRTGRSPSRSSKSGREWTWRSR